MEGWYVTDHTQASFREGQQEMKDKRRRKKRVRNTWKHRNMARKIIVHICGGKGRVIESSEAELATPRHGLILRRPEILGGPGVNGKETRCSNTMNIQSMKEGTEQSRTGGREGLRVT